MLVEGVPIVAKWIKSSISIHKDVGLIPGLARWVQDPALPQAVAYATDVARIWHCCGCGVGWQLQLQTDPYPGNFHRLQVWP